MTTVLPSSREVLESQDPGDFKVKQKTPTERLLEDDPMLIFKLTKLAGLAGFRVEPTRNNDGMSKQQRHGQNEHRRKYAQVSSVTDRVHERLEGFALSDDQMDQIRQFENGFFPAGCDFDDKERETVRSGAENDEFLALSYEYLPEPQLEPRVNKSISHAARLAIINQHSD
ncbi:MAG: hypothetical protein U5L95_01070 [Candidatus Saccharibacteria bacterium]|nr:hypothetical protein [Candidatus Saccharibacteria bacterium]